MNDATAITQRLDRLGRELDGGIDLGDTIVRRIVVEGRTLHRTNEQGTRRRSRRLWQSLAAVAACLGIVSALALVSRPATLHARMLAAIAKAATMHVTGTSSEVARKWPLEQPLTGEPVKADGYAVNLWYWNDAKGVPCSYEQTGPVTSIRQGGDLTEYQADRDLSYRLPGGYSKDRIAQLERLSDYLAALSRPGLKKEELGTREEQGRSLRGLRTTQGTTTEELWFDAQSSLPVRLTRSDTVSGKKLLELLFAANQRVPDAIADYQPPKTKFVRGGTGDEQRRTWQEHVSEVERQVLAKPFEGGMGIVPRANGRSFSLQYPMQTPSGKYWVVPLDISSDQKLTPAYFVRFYAASGTGARRAGTWRLPPDLQDQELPRCDLVYPANVSWQEWVQFALGQFGLEFVDQTEEQLLWTATHDGRKLRDWHHVQPPVPYVVEGGVEKKGIVRTGIGHMLRPVTLPELFDDFNQLIDSQDFSANKPWIVNETRVPLPPAYDAHVHGTLADYQNKVLDPQYLAATDAPYFVGNEALEMARNWYEKEFGITFREERKTGTVRVIQKKR